MHWRDLKNKSGIIIGTGPSLSEEQLAWAEMKKEQCGWSVFGVNNVYQICPFLDVLMSCNIEWWDYYWPNDWVLRAATFDKWTWDLDTAKKYSVYYIAGRWGDSLSTDPRFIHYGHASGYQIMGLAYHYGIRRMFLLGFDMAYRKNSPRHFFGEYPQPLLHHPKVGPQGEFTGLIKQFGTINEQELGLKIYNLSPNSALRHFEGGNINDF